MTVIGTLAELWRYPIKSMQGERVSQGEVSPQGLRGDRRFALIDQETGKVASAKNPRKWPGLLALHTRFVSEPDEDGSPGVVEVTFPDGKTARTDQENFSSQVSAFLGREVVLSGVPGSDARVENLIPEIPGTGEAEHLREFELPQGTFFDGQPLHLVTTSTLTRLVQLQRGSIFAAQRFRPNLLINTPEEGFPEDAWLGRILRIGEAAQLLLTTATPRCVMTTSAQADLPQDLKILQSVIAYHGANVGLYAEVVQAGRIRVGDSLRIA
jgi:uncharacterized protein YcbX